MSFPRYPKYKDSGVEWLSELPEGWEIAPLKRLAKLVTGITPPSGQDGLFDGKGEGLPWFTPDDLDESGTPSTASRYLSKEGRTFVRVLDGPLCLVCCIGSIGKIGYIANACSTNQQITAATFMDVQRYGFYSLFAARPELESNATGNVLKILNTERFGRVTLPRPPIDEALCISTFLDQETAKIDALVEEQRRLIELLKEKRQAVISFAVTKGFGLSGEERQSGSDWFETVPSHWQVKRLSQLSQIVRGGSPRPAGDPRFFNGDFIPWITVGEVTKDGDHLLTCTASMLTEEGAANSRFIESGTLIMTNSGATLGVPKILAISGCANDGILAFFELSPEISRMFLYFFLLALTEPLRERVKQGSGQPNLNTAIVGAIPVPVPPLAEQETIVQILSEQLDEMNGAEASSNRLVELLQERRSALISAAVTGKIDVRDHAPQEVPAAAEEMYEPA